VATLNIMVVQSFSAEQPVDVSTVYRNGAAYPTPHVIWWQGKRHTVTSIDLVYPVREGETQFLCYFLTCGRTQFRVRLNTQRQRWLACTASP
jgi:hypothetical protein